MLSLHTEPLHFRMCAIFSGLGPHTRHILPFLQSWFALSLFYMRYLETNLVALPHSRNLPRLPGSVGNVAFPQNLFGFEAHLILGAQLARVELGLLDLAEPVALFNFFSAYLPMIP